MNKQLWSRHKIKTWSACYTFLCVSNWGYAIKNPLEIAWNGLLFIAHELWLIFLCNFFGGGSNVCESIKDVSFFIAGVVEKNPPGRVGIGGHQSRARHRENTQKWGTRSCFRESTVTPSTTEPRVTWRITPGLGYVVNKHRDRFRSGCGTSSK